MRFFASSHQLHQLTPRTRILCALFLIGTMLQAVSGVLMHHRGPGWTPISVQEHYLGVQDPTDSDSSSPNLGAKEFATLLDVAHMHLVAMPMLLFVVAHLFSMTPVGRARWAGALCYASFAFALVDIMAPFGVRFVSPSYAWPKLVAFIGLETSLLFMTVVTLAVSIVSHKRQSASAEPVP